MNMAGALIHITDAGRAALVAPGNMGTTARKIVEIGLSNAPFDDTNKGLVRLPNEIKRITSFGGDNIAPDLIHVTLKDDTADKYTLYGFGLYFDNGVLFGVYSQDTPIMEKSPAALMLLSADMLFTTIDAAQLVFGDATFLNPPATTERQGVIELATQAEVDAGADNSRALTPRTAATRYAALTGAQFTGPVIAASNAGDTEAQLYVKAASGANGRESKVRFYGTFGNNADTNTRLVGSIRAGFDGGIWGKEYLDFYLNNATNDAQQDALQGRILRLVGRGRALFNTTIDDGTNIAQFGGNVSTRGVHTFGYGSTVAWVTSDPTIAYFRSNGHVSIGSENPAGFLDLCAGNAARARFLPSGRVLFGKSEDDLTNAVQVKGTIKGENTTGALTASNGSGAGQTSIIITREGAPTDQKRWELLAGGDGTFALRTTNDAYSDAQNALWITRGVGVRVGVMVLMQAGGRVLVGTTTDNGNHLMQIAGGITSQNANIDAGAGASATQFFSDGGKTRWTIGKDTGNNFGLNAWADDGKTQANVFSVDRLTRVTQFTGDIQIRRNAGEGQLQAGQNDGYFFGNTGESGWFSRTYGYFKYNFAGRNLYINDYAVWHGGNLSPLDVNLGGTLYNDVMFAAGKRLWLSEGSALYPSLTFSNDGAPDTGLYHIADGEFGVSCNGASTVHFTPTTTYFDKPAAGQHPPAGDTSNQFPTTAWVVSAIASSAIGQIVMEPRTSVRAGYLKANGALLNRADYPALWAYAQASGALVTDALWIGGRWGCFSSGDGATTFRVPELRGEHLRCWDDGRGVDGFREIGSLQDSQNRSHSHGAQVTAAGDHSHAAWSDTQGWHGHAVADYGHAHVTTIPSRGANAGSQAGYFGPSGAGVTANFDWGSSASASNIGINGDGNHVHGIGMNAAGGHSHPTTIYADGGAETRVRTVALLAMIRAY
jgi:microcystin-dependent protein